jgi:hypothetical protein
MSIDDTFAAIDAARSELATERFAADHAGAISPVSRQLATDLERGHDQYDHHIAHGSRTMHHDQRPLEEKAVPHDPGDGNGWPGPGQPPPWWPPTKGGGGNGGGSGSGSGGNGPPSWFKKWWQQQQHRGGMQRGGGGARGGGGGGHLAGPGSIGNVPQLGKVPIPPPGSTSSGASPIVILLVLASAGVGGYLLWHKLKLAKHQNAELAAGKEPTKDDAS